MTNKTNSVNRWAAPQRRDIKSVDVSAVIYKQVTALNPYLRTPTYRKQRSIRMVGTNSECY